MKIKDLTDDNLAVIKSIFNYKYVKLIDIINDESSYLFKSKIEYVDQSLVISESFISQRLDPNYTITLSPTMIVVNSPDNCIAYEILGLSSISNDEKSKYYDFIKHKCLVEVVTETHDLSDYVTGASDYIDDLYNYLHENYDRINDLSNIKLEISNTPFELSISFNDFDKYVSKEVDEYEPIIKLSIPSIPIEFTVCSMYDLYNTLYKELNSLFGEEENTYVSSRRSTINGWISDKFNKAFGIN